MNFIKNHRAIFEKLMICVGISFLAIIISQETFFTIGPIKSLEQKHIDERFRDRELKREMAKSADSTAVKFADTAGVVIVEIDDGTYKQIPYAWPWPRSVYAKVIDNLNKAGAKAIGIDIVMSRGMKDSLNGDADLYNKIKTYKNIVVAGKIDMSETNTLTKHLGNDISVEIKSNTDQQIKVVDNFFNIFFKADSSIGIVQVTNDDDGVVRRYMPFVNDPSDSKNIPTFSFSVLNKYFRLNSLAVADRTANSFVLANHLIPKFNNTSMLINYYGPSRTFKYYNFSQILDDQGFKTSEEISYGDDVDINEWDLIDKSVFKDKIVLIGSTVSEDKDLIPSPGFGLINGVEVHANVIENIIAQDYLHKESTLTDILIIILLTFLIFFISSTLKDIKFKYSFLLEVLNILIVGGILLGLRQLSFYLFFEHSYLTVVIGANIAVIFGYVGSTVHRFITERKQKGMIKGMFSQYVNATIVDELIANPDSLQLGGRRQDLSIFFSDIAGFSSFSENKEPEDLITFLNEYLSEMTKVVFDNKGTLDKYVGDAIMAFWGAPIPLKDHAYHACSSALKMQNRLVELRKKWKEEGQPMIVARMGINSGDMVVGNVGGTQRFDYTCMGDNVNLASRLEGANKEYGTVTMISESTYEMVKDSFFTRELDYLVVKGRTKPIKVYELLGYNQSELSQQSLDSIGSYIVGLNNYKNIEFEKAIANFNKALIINPNDGPSQTYLKRCKYLLNNPPDKSWDGVFHMTTK